MSVAPTVSRWQPPESVSREETLARSEAVLAKPESGARETEDIFRIHALGHDWDMGVKVYQPADESRIARGADGKRIGNLPCCMAAPATTNRWNRLPAVCAEIRLQSRAMTFPGRLNLNDPSRDWPGDTIHADGTVRVPVWRKGELITPDQYEVVRDTSMRLRSGIRAVAPRQARHHLLRPHGGVAGGV